jgi:hypothetical protein
MYDEIDLDEPDGEAPTFRHDIILSNGWEVSLRFRALEISRPRKLLPVAPQTTPLEKPA